jgi:hypothetical protein
MLNLSIHPPYTVQIKDGISLQCKPADSLDIAIARSRAETMVTDLMSAKLTLDVLGFSAGGPYDINNHVVRAAVQELLFVAELAVDKVVSWTGFTDNVTGQPLPCTPDNIRAVMRSLFIVANAFWQKTFAQHAELLSAKKDFATGAAGTQSQAPVAHTATAAQKTEAPVQAAGPETGESSVPTSKTLRARARKSSRGKSSPP